MRIYLENMKKREITLRLGIFGLETDNQGALKHIVAG